EIRGNDKDALRLGISVRDDCLRVGVRRAVDAEVVERIVHGGSRLLRVEERLSTRPEVALGIGRQVEARDDAEVVAASTKRPVQVGVRGLVADVANGSVRQHDLPILVSDSGGYRNGCENG